MILNHGERLNNLFNIEKNPNIKWQGEVHTHNDPVFCEFDTLISGLRAGFINLKNQIKEGYNTLALLIHKYAPPSENNTEAYVMAVSKRTGIPPQQVLGLSSLQAIGLAIIWQEQGRMLATEQEIAQAISLAGMNSTNELPSISV